MSTANQPEATEMPSSNVRSVITLLLFLHLVCIGLAILSNAPSSPMLMRIRTVPGLMDYAQLLCMDQNYRFSYTRASVFDMGNHIEVDLKESKEKGAPPAVIETVSFPEQKIEPRLRRQRWDALIWNLQYFVRLAAEDEGNRSLAGDRENIIPKAVGVYVMKEHGVKDATIRYRGRALKRIEDADRSTENYESAYEADLNISSFGNAVISQRSEGRRSAPVAGRSAGRRSNASDVSQPEGSEDGSKSSETNKSDTPSGSETSGKKDADKGNGTKEPAKKPGPPVTTPIPGIPSPSQTPDE